MRLLRVPSPVALLGLATSLAVAPVAAQEQASAPEITWEVGTPRAGWCLHFLLEAKDARKDLPKGRNLILARDAVGLPAAVERVIRDEPAYADWVPNEICTYMAETLSVDGRRFDRGDGGQPISIVYWGVSASGSGSGADTSTLALRLLATNSSGAERAMAVRSVPIDRVKVEVSPVKESEDLQYLVKLEGATILFAGHPRSDSTLSRAGLHRLASHQGNNQAVWEVDFRFEPGEVQAMAGSLRILGRHGLAKALIKSPIRLLGPVISGGHGEVHFTR